MDKGLIPRRYAKALLEVAQDKGLGTKEFHTCHNITAEDFEAGETYVSLMRRNYEMLKEVL